MIIFSSFFLLVTFPNLWTNTCCSHPLAVPDEMETSLPDPGLGAKRAAQRRIFNELGVSPDQCKVEKMTYLTRILYASPSDGKWCEHELDYILFLKADMDVNPNPDEVQDIAFVGKNEMKDFLEDLKKRNVGITPWFSLIVDSFLPKWWANIDNLEKFQNHKDISKFT